MAVLVGYQYDWELMREKGRWKLHVVPAEGKVEHGEREKRIPASSKPKHPIQSFLYECE